MRRELFFVVLCDSCDYCFRILILFVFICVYLWQKGFSAFHRGITVSGNGNGFSSTSRASVSAGVVNACTHSAAISAPRFSISAVSRSPTGCGTTTNGSVRWPMPSAVTCASGANAVLTTVTVGMPSASSSAASRAVHGVDEPQCPTPLTTPAETLAREVELNPFPLPDAVMPR